MVYLLSDKIGTYSFIKKYIKDPIIEYNSPQKKKLYLTWICGSIGVICQSKKNDTILCVLDIQAVICYWICFLTFRKRNIVAINILLKAKDTLKNKVASFLYKVALKSKYFHASVTSEEYGLLLNKYLGISKEYAIVKDVYKDQYEIPKKNISGNNLVFCGGRNGRDWNFMIDVAINMPHVNFCLALPKQNAEMLKNVPTNITLYTDVPERKFLELIEQCSIVALPLDTEAPAGLIVMFQAAAFDKMVITSNTATTRGYITEDNGCLLPFNVKDWSNAIQYYLSNQDIAIEKAKKFHEFLLSECSERKYVDSLSNLIKNYSYKSL
jgi:glycosyltransferase involved in cell wall biosynthesis